MTYTVFTKIYDAPQINTREIMRYAQISQSAPETDALINNCLKEVREKLTFKVCYAHFTINICDEIINFGFAKTNSVSLRKNLQGCESIILFAATVGIEIDRLIAKYSRISPAKALMFQAIGTERIESLCDAFNNDITAEYRALGMDTSPRFSPGYGDLPLELQSDVFNVLDCPRKIGISLNESLLMSPSKSVTAIIGIKNKMCSDKIDNGCDYCNKTNCTFRRTL